MTDDSVLDDNPEVRRYKRRARLWCAAYWIMVVAVLVSEFARWMSGNW